MIHIMALFDLLSFPSWRKSSKKESIFKMVAVFAGVGRGLGYLQTPATTLRKVSLYIAIRWQKQFFSILFWKGIMVLFCYTTVKSSPLEIRIESPNLLWSPCQTWHLNWSISYGVEFIATINQWIDVSCQLEKRVIKLQYIILFRFYYVLYFFRTTECHR